MTAVDTRTALSYGNTAANKLSLSAKTAAKRGRGHRVGHAQGAHCHPRPAGWVILTRLANGSRVKAPMRKGQMARDEGNDAINEATARPSVVVRPAM